MLKIRGTSYPDALVLSPMVDVTDAAFRSIAAQYGAQITCSEMVAAAGIANHNERSWRLLERWPGPPDESPYGVQLMGGDAEQMADAVRLVGERLKPDFLDINLGCPAPNILRSEAGGFLLRKPKAAGRVMAAAVEAAAESGIPHVSAKMRTGPANDTYLQVAEEAQAAGIAWLTLHGRSVEQGYQGTADWSKIAKLVDAASIPVVGNGDLRTPEDVVRMREETGCAGYFIARAAMHDPTIFSRMAAHLAGKPVPESPSLPERVQLALTYMERAGQLEIDHVAAMRRQATRFLSGAPGAKKLRAAMHDAKTTAEVRGVLENVLVEQRE